jgi:hypothetical protein
MPYGKDKDRLIFPNPVLIIQMGSPRRPSLENLDALADRPGGAARAMVHYTIFTKRNS